jgi:site-specific recombinase XerD
VPIDDALIAELDEHHEQRYGDDSAIAEQYLRFGYAAFRDGVERAGLTLPRGQLTHVLRHTFVSHFIMNGGNILVLQKILGHSSLTMTMRYAHLAPEHLQEAKMLNPLARLNG